MIQFIGEHPIVLTILAALGGAGVVAAGVYLLPILKSRKQGYAYEEQIEAALLPIIYQAIASAYKMSEFAVDEIGERLTGAEKHKFALAVYDMLPAKVGNFPLGILKTLISREQFADLVQIAFDQFVVFYNERHGDYVELWEEWSAEWQAKQ
jgi:hypothetical protein